MLREALGTRNLRYPQWRASVTKDDARRHATLEFLESQVYGNSLLKQFNLAAQQVRPDKLAQKLYSVSLGARGISARLRAEPSEHSE